MRTAKAYQAVRYVARFGAPFTPRDLVVFMPAEKARQACLRLFEAGELERVHRGTPGRYGMPATYQSSRPK